MTDTPSLSLTLDQALAIGAGRLAAIRQKQDKDRAARESAAQAKFNAGWTAAIAPVREAWPYLSEFIVWPAYVPNDDGPGYQPEVTIQLPGDTLPISVKLLRERQSPEGDTYALRQDRECLRVPLVELSYNEYIHDSERRIFHNWREGQELPSADMDLALAYAQEQGAKLPGMRAKIEQQKAQQLKRQQERQAAAARAESEAALLIAQLEGNPVALSLARLFVEIEADRAGWQEGIERAQAAAEESSSRASKLAERFMEEQDRASRAERERQDADYRAREAEDKASKLERAYR